MALSPTSSRDGGSGTGVTVLSYVEFTSSVSITATTAATAQTVVTAAAAACDGSTVIVVEFFCPRWESPGGGTNRGLFANLWDAVDGGAATDLGQWGDLFSSASSANTVGAIIRRVLTPASGSHVFSCRGYVSAGTGSFAAGLGGVGTRLPGYIRVTSGS